MSGFDTRRNRIAVRLANAALRLSGREYRTIVVGAIEYGMRAAADDVRNDRPMPPDWRAASRTADRGEQ